MPDACVPMPLLRTLVCAFHPLSILNISDGLVEDLALHLHNGALDLDGMQPDLDFVAEHANSVSHGPSFVHAGALVALAEFVVLVSGLPMQFFEHGQIARVLLENGARASNALLQIFESALNLWVQGSPNSVDGTCEASMRQFIDFHTWNLPFENAARRESRRASPGQSKLCARGRALLADLLRGAGGSSHALVVQDIVKNGASLNSINLAGSPSAENVYPSTGQRWAPIHREGFLDEPGLRMSIVVRLCGLSACLSMTKFPKVTPRSIPSPAPENARDTVPLVTTCAEDDSPMPAC